MLNYFNYFTEIECRFQQRRGSLLMLSTLDWAVIDSWREAGLNLEAVLRGIDLAFDRHAAKRHTARTRKINGLAWCSQAVFEATEAAREAATGILAPGAPEAVQSGFEPTKIIAYLNENAEAVGSAPVPAAACGVAGEVCSRLRDLAATLPERLEDLDRTLTVLEEKIFASLQMACSEDELVHLREETARELAPYRGKMQAVQIKQVQQQILQRRLFAAYRLPRLSLFYMRHV